MHLEETLQGKLSVITCFVCLALGSVSQRYVNTQISIIIAFVFSVPVVFEFMTTMYEHNFV